MLGLAVIWGALFFVSRAEAASLTINPSGGTFTVGSTFSVSLFLNTENESVNTIGASLSFPPDRLQLVSPSTGSSIISLWTTLPNVDNQIGKITLQGGIPGGVKVSNGLIITLTFRVKSVGPAILRFADSSLVLLNDGHGTNVLKQTSNGVYNLVLPPPAGPIVISESHPDQAQWYANSTVGFRWQADTPVDGYSYILNDQPLDFPDDISEGNRTQVTYQHVADGIHYFHVKSFKEGNWGGTTHFAVKVDASPPAQFPIQVLPDKRTSQRQPIVEFSTTDAFSGLDHYELKLIPLNQTVDNPTASGVGQTLFIDVSTPYIPAPLDLGSYDIIVRAFDKAQNYREVVERLTIVTPVFQAFGADGLHLTRKFLIPWYAVWLLSLILLIILLVVGHLARKWHRRIKSAHAQKTLPDAVASQLSELQRYRSKYGTLVLLSLILTGLFFQTARARAETLEVDPPVISTVARDITNDQIFYAGGKNSAPQSSVILYLQNVATGETTSDVAVVDKNGEWFYRHPVFLQSGNYLLWVQDKLGSQLSPPSPQVNLTVRTTAFQLGASRISYEALYLLLFLAAGFAIIVLVLEIIWHWYFGRRRHRALLKEIREAEESVRRGFALIRRDIEAELAVIHKAKLSQQLSAEEQQKEEVLLKDLQSVEQYIGKEIWKVEKMEQSPELSSN